MKKKLVEINQEVMNVVDSLAHLVNSTDTHEKEFADEIMKLHPTLQQSIMECFLSCIKLWADKYDKGWYDLRNEQTCNLAKEIMTSVNSNLFYLPHI
jgi:hypothetical protein